MAFEKISFVKSKELGNRVSSFAHQQNESTDFTWDGGDCELKKDLKAAKNIIKLANVSIAHIVQSYTNNPDYSIGELECFRLDDIRDICDLVTSLLTHLITCPKWRCIETIQADQIGYIGDYHDREATLPPIFSDSVVNYRIRYRLNGILNWWVQLRKETYK